MTLRVCVAGVSGWTGAAVTRGVLAAPDLDLTAAVSRNSAGKDVGEVLGEISPVGVSIVPDVRQALQQGVDVLIDYTSTAAVKAHVLHAIEQGVAVVIGTSGMTVDDFAEIEDAAERCNVGIVGGGNFSVTAAMMQHLALIAAHHIPHFEVLEYAWAEKEDVPSGTARELAENLGSVQVPRQIRPVDELIGPRDARGAAINGVQVHCIRMPGYTLRCEAIFGMAGERLTVSHEAGQSADPYVAGTLLAARPAVQIRGLVRGLDKLLFRPDADGPDC